METSAITKSQDTQHLRLEKLPQITGNAADDSLSFCIQSEYKTAEQLSHKIKLTLCLEVVQVM